MNKQHRNGISMHSYTVTPSFHAHTWLNSHEWRDNNITINRLFSRHTHNLCLVNNFPIRNKTSQHTFDLFAKKNTAHLCTSTAHTTTEDVSARPMEMTIISSTQAHASALSLSLTNSLAPILELSAYHCHILWCTFIWRRHRDGGWDASYGISIYILSSIMSLIFQKNVNYETIRPEHLMALTHHTHTHTQSLFLLFSLVSLSFRLSCVWLTSTFSRFSHLMSFNDNGSTELQMTKTTLEKT